MHDHNENRTEIEWTKIEKNFSRTQKEHEMVDSNEFINEKPTESRKMTEID